MGGRGAGPPAPVRRFERGQTSRDDPRERQSPGRGRGPPLRECRAAAGRPRGCPMAPRTDGCRRPPRPRCRGPSRGRASSHALNTSSYGLRRILRLEAHRARRRRRRRSMVARTPVDGLVSARAFLLREAAPGLSGRSSPDLDVVQLACLLRAVTHAPRRPSSHVQPCRTRSAGAEDGLRDRRAPWVAAFRRVVRRPIWRLVRFLFATGVSS